jgi:hypothetical protein
MTNAKVYHQKFLDVFTEEEFSVYPDMGVVERFINKLLYVVDMKSNLKP